MDRRFWLWAPTLAFLAGTLVFVLTFSLDDGDLALDDHLAAFGWMGLWLIVINGVAFALVWWADRTGAQRATAVAAVWLLAIAGFGAFAYGPFFWGWAALYQGLWLWLPIMACITLATWLLRDVARPISA